MEYMTMVAPMQRARVKRAAALKAGLRRNWRIVKRSSLRSPCMIKIVSCYSLGIATATIDPRRQAFARPLSP
jgi:hypothetical protein